MLSFTHPEIKGYKYEIKVILLWQKKCRPDPHRPTWSTSMFLQKILFDGESYRTIAYDKVLDWIFQNTNVLYEQKKETDKKSVSSVSVPGAELFSEPFLRDLELI